MKHRLSVWAIFGAGALIVVAGGYLLRGQAREAWQELNRPEVPVAVGHQPTPTPSIPTTGTAQAAPAPTPKPTTPALSNGLPKEVNLAVPFLLQAPKQNWDQPFGDACEEASEIMLDAFYDGRVKDYGADEGENVILDVVAFEDATYGHNKDTTSEEVVRTLREHFGYSRVSIKPIASADDIRRELAAGRPVIVPAYGKALLNPNFRNGGPVYHMLVIKGYRTDGSWITNDPGTRRGKDYVYPEKRLMDAIHDFNGGDLPNGKKVMITVTPN
jgi:hypothetical protein